MATATSHHARTPLKAVARDQAPSVLRIQDNPLAEQDGTLAHAVEAAAKELLQGQGLGTLDVRFRVCRELPEGLRFICKVETPPMADVEGATPPWRWWSPLMETAQDFRQALGEALEVRRTRQAETAWSIR